MPDSPLEQLDIGQWAWEFLRRNPGYQADYREFIATWQALEADYGAPPNRDFHRWKNDPRATHPAWDPEEPLIESSMSRVCTKKAQMQGARRRSYRAYEAEERNAADGHFSCKPSGARFSGRSALSRRLRMGVAIRCASLRASHPGKPRRDHAGLNQRFPSTGAACAADEEDKQLIECWMGAKWGFYQFPQDPALPAWKLEAPINWRPAPGQRLDRALTAGTEIQLTFDLALPLPAQFEAAKTHLVSRQAALKREGKALPHTLDNRRAHWMELLEAWDSQSGSLLEEARSMVDGGYREILRLQGKTDPSPQPSPTRGEGDMRHE